MSLGIPYSELGQRISAAELLLYQVYYRHHPWGEERADLRNAMSMAQTANMHRDPKRQTQPFEVNDFMPFAQKPEPEYTGKEPAGLRELFKGMANKK